MLCLQRIGGIAHLALRWHSLTSGWRNPAGVGGAGTEVRLTLPASIAYAKGNGHGFWLRRGGILEANRDWLRRSRGEAMAAPRISPAPLHRELGSRGVVYCR